MGGWSWLPGADGSLDCSVPLMDGSGQRWAFYRSRKWNV